MAPSPGSRLRLALCLVGALSVAAVHAGAPDGRSFDHARFDALLRAYVDSAGLVDYAGLARESAARDEKLALLINAYNAFTLRLILDHRPVASIKDIPSGKRWKDGAWENTGSRSSFPR